MAQFTGLDKAQRPLYAQFRATPEPERSLQHAACSGGLPALVNAQTHGPVARSARAERPRRLACQDLLPEMKAYWPDIIHSSPNRSRFWRHEWEKHGTCAAQVDALNSQRKYFGKSLALYKQLDLNSKLLKFGLKPSINYYHILDFKDALTRVYGVIPKIQCLPPEQGEDVQTIGQIELCLTKEDQRLRNCTEPGERPAGVAAQGRELAVCEDGPVFYPPPRRAWHGQKQGKPTVL
ncbi:Ribonuclease T2 [Tupaia chinensis]|uniref:Ribonuclease T2 n=1 Tax=Tupaia chinensis TaxID=246437 RepID=L9KLD2_TUPCH|nr:Ribonuclease T2 [Tupaia chinensis]